MDFFTYWLLQMINCLDPLSTFVYDLVSFVFLILSLATKLLEVYISILCTPQSLSDGYIFWLTPAFYYITLGSLLKLLAFFMRTTADWFKEWKSRPNLWVSTFNNFFTNN